MEYREIQYQLTIIIFELTTPLVSLNGFCDLLQKDSNSPILLEQAENIKNSAVIIQNKKLQLLELTRATDTPIFSSAENTARYLHEFAKSLKIHEENISKAASQIANFEVHERTERLDKDIHYILIHHKKLNALITSIETIKPNLELEIL